MRLKFLDIFHENNDGSLTPKKQIFVKGVSFHPGAVFQKGIASGGIDFHLYKYWDIEVEDKDDAYHILGFYPQ